MSEELWKIIEAKVKEEKYRDAICILKRDVQKYKEDTDAYNLQLAEEHMGYIRWLKWKLEKQWEKEEELVQRLLREQEWQEMEKNIQQMLEERRRRQQQMDEEFVQRMLDLLLKMLKMLECLVKVLLERLIEVEGPNPPSPEPG